MKSHFARRLMLNRVEATQITGAERREVGPATVLIHPSLPANSWNFATDIDCEAADFGRSLERVEAEFKRSRRWPTWLTGPYDEPGDLEARLKAAGYVAENDRTVMLASQKPTFDAAPPEGLEIERADSATVDECVQIAVQRFGWPYEWAKWLRKAALAGMERGPSHYRMYYASLNGAGVATAFTVFFAGTAGIYGMATSKDFEGRGIGRALLAHCVDEAFVRGVDVLTLQVATGSKAEKFYEKAGFEPAYLARRFTRGALARGRAGKGQGSEEE